MTNEKSICQAVAELIEKLPPDKQERVYLMLTGVIAGMEMSA